MKKYRLILIVLSVLILLGCIGMTAYLLLFNYRNVRLFKQAKGNFLQGDENALTLAESQLLQIIRSDSDNEAAFVMLGEIAGKKKVYPEQVYYCFMAYRLNPLSSENREKYINSLCFARYFDRLENFLAQKSSLSDREHQLLLYAAGHNGNINKYKVQLSRRNKENGVGELALLLFHYKHLSIEQKLSALAKFKKSNDAFLTQELFAAETELYFSLQAVDSAEKSLLQAYELNKYAFAPVLGRFYARCRNFGKALKVFEDHLSFYHDQAIALQVAEIYCLLNQTGKIAKLQADYQSDSGNSAMLSSYYFDALIALAKKDMASLKELTVPLRDNINTPLAAFMFFCADIQGNDLTAVLTSYKALLAHKTYLNLQEQADNIVSEYLKKQFSGNKTEPEKLLPLAEVLYRRKPEVFSAKLMLLAQKRTNSVNVILLKDALKRFNRDQGVIKIGIEYYLRRDLVEAERLIAYYKQTFAKTSKDMLRYEIVLNMQKKDYNKVSELFQKNFSPEILQEYWAFASGSMREKDLLFLSKDKTYSPFCRALLLLKKGNVKQSCDLLEKADAKNNYELLFFAAKTLGENGRHRAALEKYALFPQESSYQIAVWLNMAELYAESGNADQALILAQRAYNKAPQMPETQLCYADKLHRKGRFEQIPDIVKLSSAARYRKPMEKLWIAGIEHRIKKYDINTQREKIRELCRQLKVIAPDNAVALEYTKKLNKMPQ